MESWLKAAFELPHHTPSKEELYLSDCKWLHFHCNLCVSFYPALPSPPISHCIFKHTRYSCALSTCVRRTCVRGGRQGKTPSAARTFMHTKKCTSPRTLMKSQLLCMVCIWTKVFLHFSNTISVVITFCKGRICIRCDREARTLLLSQVSLGNLVYLLTSFKKWVDYL